MKEVIKNETHWIYILDWMMMMIIVDRVRETWSLRLSYYGFTIRKRI
jgi:hypothetical protein